MVEYKAEWYGVNILRVGRFTPSSKTCSCGVINKELKLSDRLWECKSCGKVNERDLLAARNIKKFALNKEKSGQELPVEPVEMSTLVESVKQEAHRSLVGG
jgi:putative transposase